MPLHRLYEDHRSHNEGLDMIAHTPDFELLTPASLNEALAWIAGGAQPFAGGTDLMVRLNAGLLAHHQYVNIWPLDELRGIASGKDAFRLGALTTYSEIAASQIINEHFPMLAAAARETGAVAIQNRGTLGGNIANASPAADSCPVLLAYDAQLILRSLRGERVLPFADFHTGYKLTAMQPGEIIEAILLPWRSGWHDQFRKVGGRAAQAIAKLSLAASAQQTEGRITAIRIAFGSCAPVPLRCHASEQQILDGRPFTLDELKPIDDIRSTADYRRQVAHNLLDAFLTGLGAR
jgi:CO/xanthine dehydrogenase FAD-binding subunit